MDISRATRRLQSVIDGIDDAQLDLPTPNPAMTVADLLDHVDGLALAFTWAATKSPEALEGGAPVADGSRLGNDWRARIARRLQVLGEAWQIPEAWTGMTAAGGVDLPGEVAGLVALDEVVVHGWDLAVATGQPYEVDDETVGAVTAFVEGFDAPRDGQLFGPPVEVGPGAGPFERLLALTGRDPGWVVPSP